MTQYNSENERMKHAYFRWEKGAKGKSDSTIVNIRRHIYMYEEFTGFKSFKKFSKIDAEKFKEYIAHKQNKKSKTLISKGDQLHTIDNLKVFFQWLITQPGYKKHINVNDIAYLCLSAKDIQIARSPKTKLYPTLEQIIHVVKAMPDDTDIQKRNRALIAFLALTGCRVTAAISMRLKHIKLHKELVEQHPQEVKTKYSKKIITYFFPVGNYLKEIFVEWVCFLKREKLFDPNKPLFPNTKLSLNDKDQFNRQELDDVSWQSTTGIRTIFKQAFEATGLEYYNPHSFRDMIVQLAYEYCKTPEDFKAWSQNLGHNSPLTTFTSYGTIDECNQGAVIKRLTKNDESKPLTRRDLEEILMKNK